MHRERSHASRTIGSADRNGIIDGIGTDPRQIPMYTALFLDMASNHNAGVVRGDLLKALLLVAAYHVLSATGQQGSYTVLMVAVTLQCMTWPSEAATMLTFTHMHVFQNVQLVSL